MNRTDILSEIKEAEKRADLAVSNAEAERKSAVAQARRDSVARIQKLHRDLQSWHDSVLASGKKKLDEQNAGVLASGMESAMTIEVNAELKIREVVDFLQKEFERSIDASS